MRDRGSESRHAILAGLAYAGGVRRRAAGSEADGEADGEAGVEAGDGDGREAAAWVDLQAKLWQSMGRSMLVLRLAQGRTLAIAADSA